MDAPQFDPQAFGLPESPALVLDLSDEEVTRRLGRALAQSLDAGAFVGLIGNLGAGKTTLVQSLVRTLAPDAEATSPTYTLLNEYETDPPVVHVDLYRLETYDELESIGYWDYAESGFAITCVEWLDRIPEAWPREGLILEMERVDSQRTARLWATPGFDTVAADISERLTS
ncbi:tRNA (adenosine(37)-N6)-threonylcarbamoyltransferase complex ATPase subunit type 1 TsaE [Persicimonas caeni]|uniref:tRNA threonylcarbamoyladenosine biosynthesis protein TsaE n=1 Tax=Persicimonas caeni TaxID=2292766 RepID=A0A4Y6Q1X6_PERCE|nr:tRNA (adenosine(37)-N6)-threonylcarbamoyltransferase complex ATPase subunit type 1 TsaE [Persicimonas caeni]QDG54601.1 tRNA (adenosine(37)-N6)-threonylcarbamoyltransferase complex ATPase subunit type 1 TsaE [Persicimonas caeni]QED35822.1 tRNA (adenosine(37)-N6)-threonylcarbamoyltransferase complex ATPase subunit type 1 TsaE [Persicimonas caeni]